MLVEDHLRPAAKQVIELPRGHRFWLAQSQTRINLVAGRDRNRLQNHSGHAALGRPFNLAQGLRALARGQAQHYKALDVRTPRTRSLPPGSSLIEPRWWRKTRGNRLRKTPRKTAVAVACVHFPLAGLPLLLADHSVQLSPSRTNPIEFLSCVDRDREHWTERLPTVWGALSGSPLP